MGKRKIRVVYVDGLREGWGDTFALSENTFSLVQKLLPVVYRCAATELFQKRVLEHLSQRKLKLRLRREKQYRSNHQNKSAHFSISQHNHRALPD